MRRHDPAARILLIDIETFPMLIFAWRSWKTYALRVVENTTICSFSAKWLGGKQITKALPDYPGYKAGGRDDKKLMADLWSLLDEADIVVAHNGDSFDVKKINYRFMVHGMKPPSPYKTVDTLTGSRRTSGFDSHRLNELCRQKEIGQKLRTGGADLWFDCLAGDMKAWAKMKRYNARDVSPLLEQWYLELRPWLKSHPNLSMYSGRPACPTCQSGKMIKRGYAYKVHGKYERFQCKSCGHWAEGKKPVCDSPTFVNAR